MSKVEGIMLKKTFPYLRGSGYSAPLAACTIAGAVFVTLGTLRKEDMGRVWASDQGDWFFCRVNGPSSCMKDYEWSDEITTGKMVLRTGVLSAPV